MQGLDQKIKNYICVHIQPTSLYTCYTSQCNDSKDNCNIIYA